MTERPEPCLSKPCRSPTACGGWGYCRERNIQYGRRPDDRLRAYWRRLASARQKAENLLERFATDSKITVEEAREFVIEHAAEIWK